MTADPGAVSAEALLQDIHALTDAALTRLSDQDFLAELLDRVKKVLQADTAVILLVDAGQLTAAAAAGLEEEVRQGVRIPAGAGFIGRIAATGQPAILDRVDLATVASPALLARGIRSMVGVPLLAGQEVIGVLHAGSVAGRTFTSDDVELLQLAADRAAVAVQSMMTRAALNAAVLLQRSLLPPALPKVAGAQAAARYVAGQGVLGGDWYDMFPLPGGRLGLVIGDVSGSGLPAAVIMTRMRSALRAYALQTSDPAEVLNRLDAKMQHFEPGALATVLYAVFDPGLDRAHIASAGHLPPVLALPGQAAVLAAIPANLMIGVDPGVRRQVTTLTIPPGATLCLYTDGLIERPDRPLDDGLALLCQAVTTQPPEDACAAVMAALIGREPARDDTALLMFHRQPTPT
jgi:putative methionine-R-sulfoxide reductase with GAF domain